MWVLINVLRKPSLGAPSYVNKILRPKMGKKLTGLNQYISVITDIDEKLFVHFEHTISQLSFGYVRLPQLEYFFLVLFFFLTFFLFLFFSSMLSTFKPLNGLYSKFERLKISSRTCVRLKSGGSWLGGSPSTGPSKILDF